MSDEPPRVVPAGAVGDLARLEPLARRIFGEGDRAQGWFRRKLERECVDAQLSRLAVRGSCVEDPKAWVGYVLVGTPASLATTARTAGTGVVEPWRGRGVGSQLLEAASSACKEAGFTTLRLPSAPDRVSFYERFGFMRRRSLVTLLGVGSGPADDLGPPGSWERPGLLEVSGWLEEAWERTPVASRQTVRVRGGGARLCVHMSREGRAWVAHRILASSAEPHGVAAALATLRQRVQRATPLLLAALDPVSSVTRDLVSDGWAVAQRSELLERPLT